MNKKELAKRYILFVVSLFFAALGVAVTKRGELGTSPISSVANVMSGRFEGMTMGVWLIVWNCLPILGQVLLLRRDFHPSQLLQSFPCRSCSAGSRTSTCGWQGLSR